VPKWKKDATEFTVGVNYNEVRGYQTSIPKPVAEVLGKPDEITYLVRGKKVEVKGGKSDEGVLPKP
jgi:hypothetical protein